MQTSLGILGGKESGIALGNPSKKDQRLL